MPDSTRIITAIQKAFQKNDEKLIKELLEAAETFFQRNLSEKNVNALSMGLADSYMDFYTKFENPNANKKKIPTSKNLQKAKFALRGTLTRSNSLSALIHKQLWVNYGNALDYIGRGIEALYAYDEALKIDPHFSMAIGNRAITSCYFADISGHYYGAIHLEAYQALRSIINDPELVRIGGQSAKTYFENMILKIERMTTDKNVLKMKLPHAKYNGNGLTDFEKFYLDFSIEHDLFLNLHILDKTCESATNDPIFINIITEIDDNSTFYRLARYINQIKEDFAVARLLLTQSQWKTRDFSSISKRTTYAYPLDYSQSNIYYGLLKSAFKESFNILDKIAVFLNMYLDLGFHENKVYFDTIWTIKEDGVKKINPSILATENVSLYALFDIYQDFQTEEFKFLKDVRHALTHRQLTIFVSGFPNINEEKDFFNVESDEMLKQTVLLMRLVKAAIIYLINAVTTEENKKKNDTKKLIHNIDFDTTQFLNVI